MWPCSLGFSSVSNTLLMLSSNHSSHLIEQESHPSNVGTNRKDDLQASVKISITEPPPFCLHTSHVISWSTSASVSSFPSQCILLSALISSPVPPHEHQSRRHPNVTQLLIWMHLTLPSRYQHRVTRSRSPRLVLSTRVESIGVCKRIGLAESKWMSHVSIFFFAQNTVCVTYTQSLLWRNR